MIHTKCSVFFKRISHLCLFCLIALFVIACSHDSASRATLLQGEKLVFQRLAVAPFQQTTPEMVDINAVDCSSCGFFTQADRFPDHPEKFIEQNFIERLKANYKISIIPPDRVSGIYERYTPHTLGQPTPLVVLRKVGADLEADGIVYGYVYRYRERKGLPYAAEKPASVAFEIHLFRVSDSALVWKGRFDKTQTSLMEDVFQASTFLRGGGKWMTAKELAEGGIEDIVKTFPAVSR